MMKIVVVLAIICITTTINIPYTENIEEFKDEFYNART
jgi:Tfp pilus assembly major pilin PilA